MFTLLDVYLRYDFDLYTSYNGAEPGNGWNPWKIDPSAFPSTELGSKRKRDVYEDPDFAPVPYTNQTLYIIQDEDYSFCPYPYPVTVSMVGADGEEKVFTENVTMDTSLIIDIPKEKPVSFNITYVGDEEFYASLTWTEDPYQYAMGDSSESESFVRPG